MADSTRSRRCENSSAAAEPASTPAAPSSPKRRSIDSLPPSTEEVDDSWLPGVNRAPGKSDVRWGAPSSAAGLKPHGGLIDRTIWDAANAPEPGDEGNEIGEAPSFTPIENAAPRDVAEASDSGNVAGEASGFPKRETEGASGPVWRHVSSALDPEQGGAAGLHPARRLLPRGLFAGLMLLLLVSVGAFFLERPVPPQAVLESATPERPGSGPATPELQPKPVETMERGTTVPPSRSLSAAVPPASLVRMGQAVLLEVRPSDAKITQAGRVAGSSGMVVEIPEGERRTYEVAKRGYVTRKVVVDGSRRKVRVVLQRRRPRAP